MIGIPALIFCVVVGNAWLTALIVTLQVLALWEWSRLARAAQIPFKAWPVLPPLIAVNMFVFAPYWLWTAPVAISLGFFWIGSAVFDGARQPLRTLGHGALFLLYAALPLALWARIWAMSDPLRFSVAGTLFVLFAATWLCDSAAYFGGRALGRHKLYEKASPNKTVEGAFFGVLGAALLLPLLRLFDLAVPTPLDYIALPLIVGVFGQSGDLLESLIKRESGVKDSSHLIPGHGGVLDRFDSLLLSTPFYFAYLYLTTFLHLYLTK